MNFLVNLSNSLILCSIATIVWVYAIAQALHPVLGCSLFALIFVMIYISQISSDAEFTLKQSYLFDYLKQKQTAEYNQPTWLKE